MLSMDFDTLINNFYAAKANTAVLLHKIQNPSQYGVAVVEEGRLTKLVEKPPEFISNLILTGVYVFDPGIFRAIEKTVPSARGELEITDAIQRQLELGNKVTYELVEGWWKDTGKIEDLLEANRMVLDEMPIGYGAGYSDSSISGKVHTGRNVVIVNSVIQGPAHIEDDVSIVNSCVGPYTSIGRGAKIKECEIDNCIILEGAELENIKKRMSKSLIGKNVSIKSLTKRPFVSSFLVGDHSEIYL